MTIAWIVYSIAITAILGLSALALEYGLRRRDIPLRWVWLAVMCGAITLSSIPWVRPSIAGGRAVVQVSAPYVGAISVGATPSRGSDTESLSAPLADAFSWSVIGAREVAPRAERYFIHAWIVLSLLVSVYVVAGHWKVSRRRRTWRETELNGVRVLISKDVGPAVVGLINQAIVLPEWVSI